MENFEEIVKKYKNFSEYDKFLSYGSINENNEFNIHKKSFNSFYKELMIDKYNPKNFFYINKFLNLYNENSKNKKVPASYLLTYKKLLSELFDVSDVVSKCDEIDKNIKLEKEAYSVYNDTLSNVIESQDKYSEKRSFKLKEKLNGISSVISILEKERSFEVKKYHDYVNKLSVVKDMYIDFESQEKRIKSDALSYVNSLNKSKITKFLTNKDINFVKWEFSKGQKLEEVLFFDDYTIAVKDKNGYRAIVPLDDNYNKISIEIFENVIAYDFRKKPNYISKINKLLSMAKYNLIAIRTMTKTFLDNETILKNEKYNFMEELIKAAKNENSHRPNSEIMDDKMNEIIANYKINQYANSILSNKYQHLYDEENKSLFKELYDLNFSEDNLQNIIGKKLAGYKTPQELNKGLMLLINSMSNFDIESIKLKAKNYNTKICLELENAIVLKIYDFKASNNIGSSSWCISRTSNYFESYSSDGKSQYFYFDFNQKSSSNTSMIGFTIEINGDQNTAHQKDDTYIDFYKKYKDIFVSTIVNDIESYNLTPDKIKEFGIEEKLNKKQKIEL